MKTIAIKLINKEENVKYILISLVALIVVFSSLYFYFLKEALSYVALRESVEKEISILNSRINPLEQKYISLKSRINMDMAYEMGFKDTAFDSKFIKLENVKTVLSSNSGL